MMMEDTSSKSPSPVPTIPESISEEELGDEIVIQEQHRADSQKAESATKEPVVKAAEAVDEKEKDEVIFMNCSAIQNCNSI